MLRQFLDDLRVAGDLQTREARAHAGPEIHGIATGPARGP
jgi:hypothetical protein